MGCIRTSGGLLGAHRSEVGRFVRIAEALGKLSPELAMPTMTHANVNEPNAPATRNDTRAVLATPFMVSELHSDFS